MHTLAEYIKLLGMITAVITPYLMMVSTGIYLLLKDQLKKVFVTRSECNHCHDSVTKEYMKKDALYKEFISYEKWALIQEKTNLHLEGLAKSFDEFKEDTKMDMGIIKEKVDKLLIERGKR